MNFGILNVLTKYFGILALCKFKTKVQTFCTNIEHPEHQRLFAANSAELPRAEARGDVAPVALDVGAENGSDRRCAAANFDTGRSRRRDALRAAAEDLLLESTMLRRIAFVA